ncbi:GntR family transcriptional regulator [Lactobacillus gigeriorum]|uniref:Transcriptional regulator n=1 Tax=Lactobacillus gigeriorum DSM 23908 = CRBIP 24.85 TaxID=1423751 RepID=I7J1U3_9LACO|nr:GntR family transcriptional regulator [Lactobacillus gigeriorum]KRN13852.1 transcriptional regulator [Lactobacillus gigeriorum DSM 23908 = CRBIP 24.85]CCI86467.1 Transcriptional regulator [Lactobacillus gigeriorum DSM 23908 = CRBIP 24.85]
MSRKDEAYSYIRTKIIKGDFLPEQVLSENTLTEKIGVSRTPVREALHQLSAEGLVDFVGRTTIVAPLTKKDVEETYELRTLLETYALEKTVARIPNELLNQVEREFKEAAKEHDWQKYLEVDIKFHGLITNIHQKQFAQLLNIIRSQTDRTRYINAHSKRSMDRSLEEHLQIIDKIRKRNFVEAKKALEYHLQRVYEAVLEYIDYL